MMAIVGLNIRTHDFMVKDFMIEWIAMHGLIKNNSWFSSNSETKASELLEKLEEMSPFY